MPEDFKEKYIRQQKADAALRAERLRKIGMGDGEKSDRQLNTARSVRTSAPQEDLSAYRDVRQRTAPQGRTPAVQQGNPAVQRRPVAQQGTPAAQRRPAAQQGTPASQRRPAAQQGTPAMQRRPAAQQSTPTSQRRPNPQAGNINRATRVNSGNNRDDAGFKRNLSDDESRAMMFSLTGKAENPSYGGDVDLIDMGRIGTGRKNHTRPIPVKNAKSNTGKYVGRFFFSLLSVILFVVVTAYVTIFVIAHGPSESMRDLLVQSAEQASATKWVPYLVLSKDTVHEIINKSEEVVQDVISIDDYNNENNSTTKTEDEWANAKDPGVILDIVKGSTYKAYVMLVKDPARVFVGTSTDDFTNATAGVNIFEAAARHDALACINGGEFLDNGGHGSGYAPLGLTFSKGECVFDDGSIKTFMGFTNDNKLIVKESMTANQAKELGIRDAVSFQNGNTLIEKDGDKLVMYYADSNTGTSQRSAIGQREDGTVIMIVTDGRTASSPGATHNDMIDLMVSYGAVSAGMLDGGSSAMMYYENHFDKFGLDKSTLDEYQLQGLVNSYKAFTEPRRIPTFFMVSK